MKKPEKRSDNNIDRKLKEILKVAIRASHTSSPPMMQVTTDMIITDIKKAMRRNCEEWLPSEEEIEKIIANPHNWLGMTESAQCKYLAKTISKSIKEGICIDV